MRRLPILFVLAALLLVPGVALAQCNKTAASDMTMTYATGSGMTDASQSGNQMASAGVSIVDFAFSPSYVSVPAGTTVSWYNAGAAPHTVTSDAGIFDSGTLGSGGGYALTFSTPGYYSYHCAIHPGMTGAVEVY